MRSLRTAVLILTTLTLVVAAATTVATAQTYTDLFNFNGTDGMCGLGWVPASVLCGPLAQGRDGNLYGTAAGGGAYDYGVMFRISARGLKVLYNFDDGVDGGGPVGLTLGTDGSFYGATVEGGNPSTECWGESPSCGTIFKITPGGSLTTLHEFTGGTDGGNPGAPPIEGTDGNFYGTTDVGDPSPSFYKITPSGNLTVLGSLPSGSPAPVLQATDGNFYGTTPYGGPNSCNEGGCGTVFKMTAKGVLTVVYSFDNTHGEFPGAPVIQGSDGNFYGTAPGGGSYGGGVVYELTPQGAITVLHNFPDPNYSNDGNSPTAGLVQATDGNFYGTTYWGGTSGGGVIFQITPTGTYSILHDFNYTSGAYPECALVQHTNGMLYGMASDGGPSLDGVVYSLDMGLGPFVSFVFPAGKVGKTAEILGQGFTGTTGVSFNGTAANFKVISDTFLGAAVPAGATSGFVTVTTPTGTLASNKPFIVIP